MRMRMWVLAVVAMVVGSGTPADARAQESRWYKGNLHMHSYWSDGKAFPELAVGWYEDHGYHFVSLTDHNILSRGQRWAAVGEGERISQEALDEYRQAFGEAWVEDRNFRGRSSVRVKPLEEWRHLLEKAGEFLIIEGEEITGRHGSVHVHVNAINLAELIEPARGEDVRAAVLADLAALDVQHRQTDRPMLAFVNHPNWSHMDPEHLLGLQELRFFEVCNGGTADRHHETAERITVERLWDVLLAERLANRPEAGLIYGVATDDTHDYKNTRPEGSMPGRGWVMVRASYLTPESIIRAMQAGDFYASCGVELADVIKDDESLSVRVEPRVGVEYTIRFIGTRKGAPLYADGVAAEEPTQTPPPQRYSDKVGEVLAEMTGPQATYRFQGDELYVRATIISSAENPRLKGVDKREMAWTQPVRPGPDEQPRRGPRP